MEDEIDIVAHGLLHEVDLGRVLGIARGDHVVGRGIVKESEKEVERETGVELGETSPPHLEDMIGIEGKKHATGAAATAAAAAAATTSNPGKLRTSRQSNLLNFN